MLDARPAPAKLPASPLRPAPFYQNLEALRGICALLVVLYHVEFASPLTQNFVIRQGWLFVDFFFVLSGFVITLIHNGVPTGWNAARRFLIRRFFRLYPLHVTTMIVVIILLGARISLDPASAAALGVDTHFKWLLLANLAMVQAWGLTERVGLNVPSWSISTEWFAYLITAILFAVVAPLRLRIGGIVLLGLCALLILISAGLPVMDGAMLYRLPRCLFGFSLGALVYALSSRFPVRTQIAAFAIQLAAIAAIITLLFILTDHPRLELVFPLLSARLLTGAIADRGTPLFRFLTTGPAQALGRLSYSIYLIHIPMLMVANFVSERLVGKTTEGHAAFSPMMAAVATIVTTGAIMMVSLVTQRWIEVPWRERGRHIAARLPA